jgi:hypothetical protein
MTLTVRLLPAALLVLSACVETTGGDPNAPQIVTEIPEPVRAAAAPFQSLAVVERRPDGCYWYQHVGPVETTFLPLRTVEGRPICVRPASEVAATATSPAPAS